MYSNQFTSTNEFLYINHSNFPRKRIAYRILEVSGIDEQQFESHITICKVFSNMVASNLKFQHVR